MTRFPSAFDVDVIFDPFLLSFNSAIFGDPILGGSA